MCELPINNELSQYLKAQMYSFREGNFRRGSWRTQASCDSVM